MPNHIHPIGRELASEVVLLSRREKKRPGRVDPPGRFVVTVVAVIVDSNSPESLHSCFPRYAR